MITNSFRGDLTFFINKIKNKEPFILSRWADGEYSIMNQIGVTNSLDNWEYKSDIHITTSMSLLLSSTSGRSNENSYYGISCPCCNSQMSEWYREFFKGCQLTWSNVFVNSNYKCTRQYLWQAINSHDGNVTLVANHRANKHNIPFGVDRIINISEDLFLDPSNNRTIKKIVEISKEEDNQLFLLAAGPFSNMVCGCVQHSKNTFIDIGSTLDYYIGGQCRPYVDKSSDDANKTCIW